MLLQPGLQREVSQRGMVSSEFYHLWNSMVDPGARLDTFADKNIYGSIVSAFLEPLDG